MTKTCLFILLTFAASVSPLNFTQVQKSVRPLQDMNGRNICTVTSINQDKHYWLTAAHCVLSEEAPMLDGPESVEPTFVETHPTEVVFADRALDLAVLKVAELSVPAVKIAKAMPAVGSVIIVVGHPVGLDQVQLFQGYVASLRTEVEPESWYMMYDLTVCGGNSGSVVVNKRDEVVSVVQIGYGRPCSGFSGGATWQALGRVRKYFD